MQEVDLGSRRVDVSGIRISTIDELNCGREESSIKEVFG